MVCVSEFYDCSRSFSMRFLKCRLARPAMAVCSRDMGGGGAKRPQQCAEYGNSHNRARVEELVMIFIL